MISPGLSMKDRSFIFYIIVGLIAFTYRTYVNFNQELILGVNGGYYPLQVRYIIENGKLGFSDMPLLFYLDAGIIKFILLFGVPISDTLILNVVKWVDCLSIPLLLLPLYKIIKLQSQSIPFKLELGLILFAVLSFSPLILVADLQKNALAITFLFFFIAFLWEYFESKNKKQLIFCCIFLILTGLTHFGTFVVSILFGLLNITYIFRQRAIIPIIIAASISFVLIGIFDFTRLSRLLSVGSSLFSRPALLSGMIGPPDIFNILFSWGLAIVGIKILKNKNGSLLTSQKGFIFASIILLIALSFPLLEGQYFRRLSLFLFIPQIVLIIIIAHQISQKTISKLSYSIFLVTSVSLLMMVARPKDMIIDQNGFADLRQLNSYIKKDERTIVIAKHGLEWWTAWVLHTKVGQEKAIKDDFYNKYENIYFLHQNTRHVKGKEHPPFPEPQIPENTALIYKSDSFKVFALIKTK
jgi:fumarate reductase subunit C